MRGMSLDIPVFCCCCEMLRADVSMPSRPGHGRLRIVAAGGDLGGGAESGKFELYPRKNHKVRVGVLGAGLVLIPVCCCCRRCDGWRFICGLEVSIGSRYSTAVLSCAGMLTKPSFSPRRSLIADVSCARDLNNRCVLLLASKSRNCQERTD